MRDFRDEVLARVALTQPLDCVVRLPAQVLSPRVFDVDPGDVLDLTGVRFLSANATPGLISLARRVGAVHLLARPGFQPLEKLRRLFGRALTSDPTREHGWVLNLTLGD